LRARVDHGFVGVDPPWGASPDVRAQSAKASAALLSSALVMDAIEGADHGVDVTLTNDAGHAVPTGVAFLRGIWVDAVYTDSSGKSLRTGAVLTLGAMPTKNGAPVALITDADAVNPNVLAPGASQSVHVPPPPGMAAPVSVVVRLHARAIDPDALTALGLSDRADEVPTHDLASMEVKLH
jgi:hypothetical protein